MKKYIAYKRTLLALFLVIVLSSFGQQQITHTATKENISCNYDCTLLDITELNDNPSALLFLKSSTEPGGKPNPHPVGFYYFKGKWHIINLDQRAVLVGTTFQVEYLTKADSTHFQYEFTKADIQRDGSAWIDHPALNNNPTARFTTSPSWIPEKKAFANREEAAVNYDTTGGRWSVSNLNKKPLFDKITYNISISGPGRVNPLAIPRTSTEIKELTVTPNANPTFGAITDMYMTAWADGIKLPGDNIRAAYLDKTEVFSLEMAATNLAVRKNTYDLVTIKIRSGFPVGVPLLNVFIKKQSMVFTIDAVTTDQKTGKEVINYTIKLTGAYISSYKQTFSNDEISFANKANPNPTAYDEIKITFTKIEYTNSAGSTAVDNQ